MKEYDSKHKIVAKGKFKYIYPLPRSAPLTFVAIDLIMFTVSVRLFLRNFNDAIRPKRDLNELLRQGKLFNIQETA